jgi:hypothetical protein
MSNKPPLEEDLTAPRLSISVDPMITKSDPKRRISRAISATPAAAKKVDVQDASEERHRRSVSRPNGNEKYFELDETGRIQVFREKEKERAPVKKRAPTRKNVPRKHVPEDDAPVENVHTDNVTEADVNGEGVSGQNAELDENDTAFFCADHGPQRPIPGSDSTLSLEPTPTPGTGRLPVPRFSSNLGRQDGAAVDKGEGPAHANRGPVTPLVGAYKVVSKDLFKDVDYTKPSGSTKKKQKKGPLPEDSHDEGALHRESIQVPEIEIKGANESDWMLDVDGLRGSNRSQQPGVRQHYNSSQQPDNSQQSDSPVQRGQSSLPHGTQSTPIDVDGLPQDKHDMEGQIDPVSTPPDDDENPKVVLEEQARSMLLHIIDLACQPTEWIDFLGPRDYTVVEGESIIIKAGHHTPMSFLRAALFKLDDDKDKSYHQGAIDYKHVSVSLRAWDSIRPTSVIDIWAPFSALHKLNSELNPQTNMLRFRELGKDIVKLAPHLALEFNPHRPFARTPPRSISFVFFFAVTCVSQTELQAAIGELAAHGNHFIKYHDYVSDGLKGLRHECEVYASMTTPKVAAIWECLRDMLIAEYWKAEASDEEPGNPHTPAGKSDAEGHTNLSTPASTGAPTRSQKRAATEQGGWEGVASHQKPKSK